MYIKSTCQVLLYILYIYVYNVSIYTSEYTVLRYNFSQVEAIRVVTTHQLNIVIRRSSQLVLKMLTCTCIYMCMYMYVHVHMHVNIEVED